MQGPLGKVRRLCLTLEAINFLSLTDAKLPHDLQDLMTGQEAARQAAHQQVKKLLENIAAAASAACQAAMTAITHELEHFAQKQVHCS